MCACCSSRSRLRYCAWIVRSRLVVGSSAMSSARLAGDADGADDALAHAARHLVGYAAADASAATGMRTAFSSSRARLQAVARPAPLVHPDRLRHLVADGEQRVQRGHRVLQDHGDALAAHAAHLGVGFLQQVLALEQHRPPAMRAAVRQQAQDASAPACVLPEPDSPTMPSVSPALMRSETSSTARTTRVPPRET